MREHIVGVWIACSERMPDNDRRVLIGGAGWYELGWWRGDHWRVLEESQRLEGEWPTHWADVEAPH